jgi:phosphohistidine swiveling domain-containing protein
MDQDLFLLDAQTVELFEQSLVASHNDNRILGTTAYPGKATGRVRVVRDFHGVILHPGDILVTGMTDPNYVPLMRQAGAIVTDAGGMLCHAAIVSRELGKPCVIGTKIATQVLKDGDLVEVDADNGVIKIIQSVKDSDTTSNQEVKKNVEAKLSQSPSKSIWMNGVEWGVWASRNISLWHDYLMDEGFFWHLKDFGLNIQLHIMMIIHEGTGMKRSSCDGGDASQVGSWFRRSDYGSRGKLVLRASISQLADIIVSPAFYRIVVHESAGMICSGYDGANVTQRSST